MIIPGAQLSEANEKKKLMVCLTLVSKTLKSMLNLKKRFLFKMHFLRHDLECEVYFSCTVGFDAPCITEVLGSDWCVHYMV